jgi:hypothetical protein
VREAGSVGLDFSRGITYCQLIDTRGVRQSLFDVGPRNQQIFRRRRPGIFRLRFFEAQLGLLNELGDVRCGFFFFDDDKGDVAVGRQIFEERGRSTFLVQRNNRSLIERFNRALRGRIVPADRLDSISHELDANRIVGASRKVVDDAATDAELAVFIHRILAGETRVG